MELVEKRGFEFLSAMKYIRQNHGEEGLKTILEQLSVEHKSIFEKEINTITWYPAVAYLAFMSAADKLYADGRIYVVVAVVVTIFVGVVVYLVTLDKKISKIEKTLNSK